MKRLILLLMLASSLSQAQEITLQKENKSNEIRTGDGRLVEDLSKRELVCLIYFMWWHQSNMTCYGARDLYKADTTKWDCGESVKLKAEACKMAH